jgi:hypothetical protein
VACYLDLKEVGSSLGLGARATPQLAYPAPQTTYPAPVWPQATYALRLELYPANEPLLSSNWARSLGRNRNFMHCC